MPRSGVATVAVVGAVVVVLAVAAVFGYMYLIPSKAGELSNQTYAPNIPVTQASSTTTEGSIEISNAALSNNSLLVTIQNTGSEAVSIESLTLSPGSGGCSVANFTRASFGPQANQTGQTNRTGTPFTLPSCVTGSVAFIVQKNSTLTPLNIGRFNFTGPGFNFTAFNSTSFSRSANFSRTFSGNSSRTFSGNFTAGNFTNGFPGGFGNFSDNLGVQVPAGQAVTLEYTGAIGSGVTAGSQYTIMVVGQQADAQITLSAS